MRFEKSSNLFKICYIATMNINNSGSLFFLGIPLHHSGMGLHLSLLDNRYSTKECDYSFSTDHHLTLLGPRPFTQGVNFKKVDQIIKRTEAQPLWFRKVELF